MVNRVARSDVVKADKSSKAPTELRHVITETRVNYIQSALTCFSNYLLS